MGDKKGKQWRGQAFVTDKTAEDVAAEKAENAKYEHEHAVPIEVWFQNKGHLDPVKQAAMRAYTKVRKATIEAFDDIFKTF